MLILCLFSFAFATEAERQLHKKLFDENVYNPRVIQDSWRKANREDFDNIKAFAEDKCTGYNPSKKSQVELGSMTATDSFATANPYENGAKMEKTFRCSGNDTAHIRLDYSRGFETENTYDVLKVSYAGYTKSFSGGISQLDSRLKTRGWTDTKSKYLQLSFTSDGSVTRKGFKFDVMCRDDGDAENAMPTKQVILTNDVYVDYGKLSSHAIWTKEIKCSNPHETIAYRLMTELINGNEEPFDAAINEILSLTYGDSQAVLSSANSNWIDTASNKMLAYYNPVEYFTGTKEVSEYGEENDDINDAIFSVEAKCEVKASVQEVVDKVRNITVNETLLNEMYNLNTVDDVMQFVATYKKQAGNTDTRAGNQPGPLVQSQVDLIQKFQKDGLKGYVMKTSSGTVFETQIRRELCVQFLTTSLTRDLFQAAIDDFTEIFDENDKVYGEFNSLVNPNQELSGYVFDPIEVDLNLQVKAINEINLNEEYMDASVVITMEWFDKNLAWQTGKIDQPDDGTADNRSARQNDPETTAAPDDSNAASLVSTTASTTTTTSGTTSNSTTNNKGGETERASTQVNINSIRADKSQVWIPEIEILNRVNDFSPIDEKQRQLKVVSSGKVRYTRAYRMRAMLSSSLSFYPYDVQYSELILSSSDYSSKKVRLLTERWLERAGNETDDGWYEVDLANKDDAIKYKYYNGNTEWNFFAYKIVQSELYDWVGDSNYSTITIKFAFERNAPYYMLTLIIPIIVLTMLAPIGLIIPVESGEKLGFQVTLLLTVVIYIDYLQNNIPVFDSIGQTPNLLIYFVVLILLMTLALLVTTHTLFLYFVNSYESSNFSKSEAVISMKMSKMFTYMTFKLWEIDVPETVQQIADHPTDDISKDFAHEDLQ